MTDKSILVQDSAITWIETISGSRIKVRKAEIVQLVYSEGMVGEPAYEVLPVGSLGVCYVPVRSVARIDVGPVD